MERCRRQAPVPGTLTAAYRSSPEEARRPASRRPPGRPSGSSLNLHKMADRRRSPSPSAGPDSGDTSVLAGTGTAYAHAPRSPNKFGTRPQPADPPESPLDNNPLRVLSRGHLSFVRQMVLSPLSFSRARLRQKQRYLSACGSPHTPLAGDCRYRLLYSARFDHRGIASPMSPAGNCVCLA